MAGIYIIYFDINTGYYPGVNHGLASLAASVRQEGHSFYFHHLTKRGDPKILADKIIEDKPDIIGFSFSTNQRQYVSDYADVIYQKTKILQITGGIHPTIDPIDTFKINSFSGICIGEGEYPLAELLRRIDNRENIYDIYSFWWRNYNGDLIRNPIQPVNLDLSHLPFPDYSIFDTQSISKSSLGWVAMQLTRGCPCNCYYCCNNTLRNIYPKSQDYVRTPPLPYAINLIKQNLKHYKNPRGINFSDDLLIANQNWFNEFTKAYRKEIGLPYVCNGRIEYLSGQTIKILKDSGCRVLNIGIESGNEWVRNNLLNRHHSNKEAIEVLRKVKKAGISIFTYNIVGLPFETKEQMEETLRMNEIIKPEGGTVFYFYPYPATKLSSICKEFNLLLNDYETNTLSSYLEKPAIKLTYCRKEDCIKIYNKIRLFLLSQTIVFCLKFPRFFSKIFCYLLNLRPIFFVNIITKNSEFKFRMRKLFYKYFYK